MLDFTEVEYAMWFANYQKNSCIRTQIKAKGEVLWKKELSEFGSGITIAPRGLLLRGDKLGYVSQSDLLLFNLDGKYSFTRHMAMNKPVIFFNDLIMATRPNSGFITCLSYNNKDIIEEIYIYGDWGYTGLELLRPLEGELIAVTAYGGGIHRAPRSFHISRSKYGKGIPVWSLDGDNDDISHVLLTADEKFIIADLSGTIYIDDKPVLKLEGNELRMIHTEDGKISDKIDHGLSEIKSMSLNLQNELIMTGLKTADNLTTHVIQAVTLDGEIKWRDEITESDLTQPPICTENRVYIFSDSRLKCYENGNKLWEYTVLSESDVWFTAAADNKIVFAAGRICALLDPNGKEIFNIFAADISDKIEVPPVIDKNGRIYLAGTVNLYCVN